MWLCRYAVRHPFLVLVAAALTTLAAAPGMRYLRLRTDGHALVPPDAPEVLYDRQIRDEFGVKDQMVVIVETDHPDGIYNAHTLGLVRALSERFARLPGLDPQDISSLATERSDRVRPGTLDFVPFLEPFPESPQQLQKLRFDMEDIGLFLGTIVATDHQSAAILLGVRPEQDRQAIYIAVRATIAAASTAPDRAFVVGAPVAESLLGVHLLEDLALLVPVSMLVMASIFGLSFRSVWGVVLPLTEVGACLAFVFGLMGYLNLPIYLTIAVLPVILTTIGVTDEVHVFSRYLRILEESPGIEARPAVEITMEQMWRAVTMTSVTTGIGFLSFAWSPIVPVRLFGVLMAVGIAFCLVWSLTVIPAALSLIPARRIRRAGPGEGRRAGFLEARLAALGRLVTARPRAVLVGTGLVAALGWWGVRRIYVQDSWIDAFSRRSDFYQHTQKVNAAYHGTHLLLISWDTGDQPDRLKDPQMLNQIGLFEQFLESQPSVGGVIGTHDYITTTSYLMLARRPGSRSIHENRRTLNNTFHFYRKIRGEYRNRQTMDEQCRRTLITVFLKNANFMQTGRLMDAVREYERKRLVGLGVKLGFAGDVAVSQAMIRAIVNTQVISLGLSVGGDLLATSLLFGSLLRGLFCVIPVSLAVWLIFTAMGAAGVPLGVATSMFCAITLGVGVDYAIHLLHWCGRQWARGVGGAEGIIGALAVSGPAIIIDALGIAAGFGVLTLSRVPTNSRLGLLVVLSILFSLLGTVVVLPAVLVIWRSRLRTDKAAEPDTPPSVSQPLG